MTNNAPAPPEDIPACASRIDTIDDGIVALLAERFRYSRHIGLLKARLVAAPFDPARVATQKASFARSCARAGLDATMAATLIGAILDQVIAERLEPPTSPDAISKHTSPAPGTNPPRA